jgi:L-cysteine:1D-myo-inositol 2-amino-2-deoxy-alpha-D-glucopyranoside ligase
VESWIAPAVPRIPGTPPPLHLYDTASRTLADASGSGPARMYVCGITPYDATHLGHAATYVAFDLLNRQWRDAGREVVYVQNVTDVDDPLLERAAATGADWREIAARETELFRSDMAALRVVPPEHYLGAVESIDRIVDLCVRLRDAGHAYDVDGDLYFSVDADPDFGSVSGLERQEMLALFGERGGDPGRQGKKDPLDSLLWQAAREGEPAWPSTLGPGRPGWHIECATIALDHLGPSFEVQAGGRDLIFPHHEMSAAHGETVTGVRPYARIYAHSGMVGLDGEKMSKSRGNLVFVSRLVEEGADPGAVRLALLGHHYRTDWEWTGADLDRAARRLDRWRAAARAAAGDPTTATSTLRPGSTVAQIRMALADDLDAPTAVARVDRWADGALDGTSDHEPGVVDAVDALLGVAIRRDVP